MGTRASAIGSPIRDPGLPPLLPLGWSEIGRTGTKEECLAYIEQVWVHDAAEPTSETSRVRLREPAPPLLTRSLVIEFSCELLYGWSEVRSVGAPSNRPVQVLLAAPFGGTTATAEYKRVAAQPRCGGTLRRIR